MSRVNKQESGCVAASGINEAVVWQGRRRQGILSAAMANLTVLVMGCLVFGSGVLYMHQRLSASSHTLQPSSWTEAKLEAELNKLRFLEQVASEQVTAVHESGTRTAELLRMTKELHRIRGGTTAAPGSGVNLQGRNFTARQHNRPLRTWPGTPGDVFGTQQLDPETMERREAVRDAMRHAWGGYVQYAWGHDELAPLSRSGKDTFGGLGATITDALDTLWLMEMTEEYKRARTWIQDELQFEKQYDGSVFETTIRVIGGMLAAYDLTGDEMYVRRS